MNNNASSTELCVLVAAAGIGRRMGSSVPKQHLPLAGRSVIEWSISAMDQVRGVSQLVVVASADDQRWDEISKQLILSSPLQTVSGASTRAGSVLAGLDWIVTHCGSDTWVLVHDGARPLIQPIDCDRLIDQVVASGSDGGLLGVPAIDTVKRVPSDQRIVETVDRQQIWLAMTPQMFRAGPLLDAIKQAITNGYAITDESSAMELAGHRPLIVEGRRDNIKITHPDDIALAEHWLSRDQNRWSTTADAVNGNGDQ